MWMNAYVNGFFSLFLLYCFPGKPLVSFVLVGIFEIRLPSLSQYYHRIKEQKLIQRSKWKNTTLLGFIQQRQSEAKVVKRRLPNIGEHWRSKLHVWGIKVRL